MYLIVILKLPWSDISDDEPVRIISANISSSSLNLFFDVTNVTDDDDDDDDDVDLLNNGDTDLKLLLSWISDILLVLKPSLIIWKATAAAILS